MSFSSPTGRQVGQQVRALSTTQFCFACKPASCREVSALAWISSVGQSIPTESYVRRVRPERKKRFRETWKQYATEKLEIYIRVCTRSPRACRVN